MEKNINIAEILKDKPKGTKLYSPLYGDVFLQYIVGMFITVKHRSTTANFYFNGRVYDYDESEPLLFPSRKMRDWSKFAWKKGDVLSCGVDHLCIFNEWNNDHYTEFDAEFVTPNYSGAILKTEDWAKVTNEVIIKQYISNIEEFKGGKLNLSTLDIEKQHEFKDGDIVINNFGTIVLIKEIGIEGKIYFHAYMTNGNVLTKEEISGYYGLIDNIKRFATDSEKQQLFEALAKKGKAWDADKKAIVDLKPKCEFKPFDKVLGRNEKDDVWEAELFSHYREESQYPFRCIGFSRKYCIPYNEETAHLLGTTDEWKGCEG